jgi:hypothetical protein
LISELVKKAPNEVVLKWLDARDEQSLFLSVLTLGELQKGSSRLSTGPRKDDLQAWIENDLIERFAGRILDLDLEMALIWGKLLGEVELKGAKLPVMDSLIAATAIAHGLVVVTRNAKDIERCRAKVFNPGVG